MCSASKRTIAARLNRSVGYKPAMCAVVRELGASGKSETAIAINLGISRETLRAWSATHPEFAQAMKDAHKAALAWWLAAGRAGVGQRDFNFGLWLFTMKNRFPAWLTASRVVIARVNTKRRAHG